MFGDDEQTEKEKEFVMPPLKDLHFSIEPEAKITCATIFVAFYGVSSLYASTLVDTNGPPVARINFQRSKQKALASVYLSQAKTEGFIIFNEEFEKMREIHLSDFVTKYFEFKELVILTSIAKNTLEKDDGVLLKSLQTSWVADQRGCKFEEGIAGPEADLLQWAEINGRNAMCFIGIYNDYELRGENIDDIFGSLSNKNMLSLESKHDISKQIKLYNMTKYANKLYL